VDEFQDTNGRQRDLVRLLSGDGGKLFLVGDAKQSIYRFRGADVTVFRQERERIGNIYPLEITYRAHQGLVEGLNALLRPVLGDTEDCQKPWREPFAPIKAYRAEPRPGFTSPYIELHLAVGSKKEGALDRAADALAVRLRELVEEKQVQTGEGNRNSSPISYSDVAILCRASTSFKAYEDALERAGIPYLTVAGRGFYDRPEIRDLLNALQALANPTDDLALTGLLRSPAFGLSDAALYLLRKSKRTTLWETIQQRGALDLLDDEDRQRTERAYRIIEELYQQVGRVSVADLLKEFLDRTAYRAVLLRAGQERAARNVDKLISDAHTSGMVGVGEFLEYIQSLRDVGVRESEARAGAEGSVQIMTAHAAKGLEFPIVVLGDANYSSRGRSEILLLDCSLKVLLPLKDKEGRVSAVYWLGKLRSDDQEEAEEDRLLYVAATRAREMVLVSGCVSCKDARFRLEGWLKRLGAPLELDQITYKGETLIDRVVEGIPVRFFFYDQSFQPPSRLASPSVRPAETALDFPLLNPVLPREEALDAKAAQRESVLPQRVWQVVSQAKHPHAPAWVVGSLVHDALAVWRFPDVEFSAWAEARARSYGITDPQELKDAVSRSRLLLNRFRAHALFTEMAQADRRFHEVPYSLVVDGRVESGVIDALYRHGGQWTLVEFKTDEVRGEKEMEELLSREDYLPQIRRYVLAVEKMLGERPRALLCFLNYRGGIHIKEI
jgi:ATP-dependent helicase/nuclease subunit A